MVAVHANLSKSVLYITDLYLLLVELAIYRALTRLCLWLFCGSVFKINKQTLCCIVVYRKQNKFCFPHYYYWNAVSSGETSLKCLYKVSKVKGMQGCHKNKTKESMPESSNSGENGPVHFQTTLYNSDCVLKPKIVKWYFELCKTVWFKSESWPTKRKMVILNAISRPEQGTVQKSSLIWSVISSQYSEGPFLVFTPTGSSLIPRHHLWHLCINWKESGAPKCSLVRGKSRSRCRHCFLATMVNTCSLMRKALHQHTIDSEQQQINVKADGLGGWKDDKRNSNKPSV